MTPSDSNPTRRSGEAWPSPRPTLEEEKKEEVFEEEDMAEVNTVITEDLNEDVMEEAGIIVDASDEESLEEEITDKNTNANSPNDLSKASVENLHVLLNDALKIEDYVLAAKIRDEIDLRK